MSAFLIAREGPLSGLIIRLDEGSEWVLGRDPAICHQPIEDPMVSRKHAICFHSDEGFFVENVSSINPTLLNGEAIEEPMRLSEGDLLQIGNTFLYFTLQEPGELEEKALALGSPTIYEESDVLEGFSFSGGESARWIIKVIAGPNLGAEFELHEDSTFIVGKDPNHCDILFQDLSVSRQHARISVSRGGEVTIEDLGSLNKVRVNGEEVTSPRLLETQDYVALGTTTFLVIDQKETRKTIISPAPLMESPPVAESEEEESLVEEKEGREEEPFKKSWKRLTIPSRHLALALLFALLLLVGVLGSVSLFRSSVVELPQIDEGREVKNALQNFPEVEFSFNTGSGKLFIVGHVMTEIDLRELLYKLSALHFVVTIENNVIIDERVWESTNALLSKNAMWRGVTLTSLTPGHFILRGYVQSLEDAAQLQEYINLNFLYLDKLENQVVVENTLEAQIQALLLENQFNTITFQLSNGELILGGRLPSNQQGAFNGVVTTLTKIKGIRAIKNFVVLSKPISEVIDLSSNYRVSGSSKYGNKSQYVVINGKILSVGSDLDGMRIVKMEEGVIFLEKDGVKYKIQYTDI